MRSYQAASTAPTAIREALLKALDLSLANVPSLPGHTYVFVDTSQSMNAAITGSRAGHTSTVTCREVAALYAAALMAKAGDDCTVMCFTTYVHNVLTQADATKGYMHVYEKIRAMPQGGTNCSAPMKMLLEQVANGAPEPGTIIYLSDNESWFDSGRGIGHTETQAAWNYLATRFSNLRAISIDMTPTTTTQMKNNDRVLNVGGFSNSVFDLVAMFANGELDGSISDVIAGVTL
jgi:60 kDa SS-A/Ro ribonucleoprotein